MIPLLEKWVQTNHYNENGKMYFDTSLILASKGLPVQKMRITKKIMDEKIHWTLNSFFDLKVHIDRINKSDLKYPVIVGPKDKIIDGRHRLMKAVLKGKKSLDYVKLDKLPPPDKFK